MRGLIAILLATAALSSPALAKADYQLDCRVWDQATKDETFNRLHAVTRVFISLFNPSIKDNSGSNAHMIVQHHTLKGELVDRNYFNNGGQRAAKESKIEQTRYLPIFHLWVLVDRRTLDNVEGRLDLNTRIYVEKENDKPVLRAKCNFLKEGTDP
jgi:hypothetical protein